MEYLRDFFSTPLFEDELEMYRAHLISMSINITIFTLLSVFLVGLAGGNFTPSIFIWIIVAVAINLGLRSLVQKRNIELASKAWIIFSIGITTLLLATMGTVRAPIVAVYVIVVALAGLMLDRKSMYQTAAVCSASILLLIMAENNNILPHAIQLVNLTQWVLVTCLMLGMGLIINIAAGMIMGILKKQKQLGEISKVISAELNLDKLLGEIVRRSAELVEADAGALTLFNENGTESINVFEYNIPAPLQGVTHPKGTGMAWFIYQMRKATILDDYPKHPNALPALIDAGLKYYLGLPIIKSDQYLGTLGLYRANSGRPFTQQDLRLMESIASQATVAIETARLYTTLRNREAILEAVAFSGRELLISLDWRQSIHKILERLGQATRASHAYIFEQYTAPDGTQYSSQTYEWTAPGVPPSIDDPEYQNCPIYEPGAERWNDRLSQGEAFFANENTFTEAEKGFFAPYEIKSILEVGIIVNQHWWGTIGFDDINSAREWTQAEAEAVKVAAGVLGSAIQHQKDDKALHQTEETHRAELEKRVQERTAQLEQSNQELESFTYTVSHDLRAPLRAIVGFSRIVSENEKENISPDSLRLLENIGREARRLGKLIDDLLEYTRMNRRETVNRTVNLNLFIEEVINRLDKQLEMVNGTIETAPNLPTISVNLVLLKTVLTNLIENSIKFHREGIAPHVFISCTQDERSVTLSIQDNGIGIPPEYKNRIFKVFHRLHHDDEYAGTGIGLAIVHRAVGLMHGEVWVESTPGEGSTFYVRLPL